MCTVHQRIVAFVYLFIYLFFFFWGGGGDNDILLAYLFMCFNVGIYYL